MIVVSSPSRRQHLMQALLILVMFIMAQLLASACALLQLRLTGAVTESVSAGSHLLMAHSRLFIYWTAGWYVILLVALWVTRLCRRNGMTAGRRQGINVGRRDALRAVCMFFLLVTGCGTLTSWWDLPDAGTTALFQSISSDPVGILTLSLVGPLVEECVFREGIARHLHRSGLQPIWAAGIAGLAFAISHGNLAQAVPAFIMGWALGLLYFRTGDLRLCYPVHVANNVLAVSLLHMPSVESEVSASSPVVLATVTLVCLSTGAYLLYKWTIQPLRQCR